MVTGKNREQFEEWYVKEFCNDISFMLYSDEIKLFNSLHFEMQIGVYLAYYDSNEVYINIEHIETVRKYMYSFYFKPMRNDMYSKAKFITRNEAYKEAFKEADKLKNGKI